MRGLFALVLAVSFASAAAQQKDSKPPSGWSTPQTVPSASPNAPPPPQQNADESIPLSLPAAHRPPLALTLLKATSLSVCPFVKESAAGSADKPCLEATQKTFFDV